MKFKELLFAVYLMACSVTAVQRAPVTGVSDFIQRGLRIASVMVLKHRKYCAFPQSTDCNMSGL